MSTPCQIEKYASNYRLSHLKVGYRNLHLIFGDPARLDYRCLLISVIASKWRLTAHAKGQLAADNMQFVLPNLVSRSCDPSLLIFNLGNFSQQK